MIKFNNTLVNKFHDFLYKLNKHDYRREIHEPIFLKHQVISMDNYYIIFQDIFSQVSKVK